METFEDLWTITTKVKLSSEEEELIVRKISPILQEFLLSSIRPKDEVILKWKYTEDGMSEFLKYMESKFYIMPNRYSIESIWNFFSRKKVMSRNKTIIKKFRNANRNTICSHCGTTKGDFHVDHIVPLSKGGLDTIENLQYLCETCNLEKSNVFDCNKILF